MVDGKLGHNSNPIDVLVDLGALNGGDPFVQEMRAYCDGEITEEERLKAELDRKDRDFALLLAAIVRKIGGRLVVTDRDLVAADGTLVQTQEPNGDRVYTLKASLT